MSQRLFVSEDGKTIINNNKERQSFGDNVERIKSHLATVGHGLQIKKSSIPDAGYGVFATRAYRKNELITYYHGGVSKRIELADLDPSYKTHARRINGYYTMYGNFTESGVPINFDNNSFEQVANKGAGAFLNAKNADEANCDWFILRSIANEIRMDETEDPFQIVILIVARKRLYIGSELFIDYGEQYWQQPARSGITRPTFITRETYYASLEKTKNDAVHRVIKRVAPTLISDEDDQTNKKRRVGKCVSCLVSTPMVDTGLNAFFCSLECRDEFVHSL